MKSSKDYVTRKVTVDRRLKLKEMIQLGAYQYIQSDINDIDFTIDGEGLSEVDVALFPNHHCRLTQSVKIGLAVDGFRPTVSEELLALGAQYPSIGLDTEVVAIDPRWMVLDQESILYDEESYIEHVLVIGPYLGGRSLTLRPYRKCWAETILFAGVRLFFTEKRRGA